MQILQAPRAYGWVHFNSLNPRDGQHCIFSIGSNFFKGVWNADKNAFIVADTKDGCFINRADFYIITDTNFNPISVGVEISHEVIRYIHNRSHDTYPLSFVELLLRLAKKTIEKHQKKQRI